MINFSENKKLTVATIITFILALWQMVAPTVEVIFGAGSKEFLIISTIITALSFAYNYFFPNKSLFKTLKDHIGTRPTTPPKP